MLALGKLIYRSLSGGLNETNNTYPGKWTVFLQNYLVGCFCIACTAARLHSCTLIQAYHHYISIILSYFLDMSNIENTDNKDNSCTPNIRFICSFEGILKIIEFVSIYFHFFMFCYCTGCATKKYRSLRTCFGITNKSFNKILFVIV